MRPAAPSDITLSTVLTPLLTLLLSKHRHGKKETETEKEKKKQHHHHCWPASPKYPPLLRTPIIHRRQAACPPWSGLVYAQTDFWSPVGTDAASRHEGLLLCSTLLDAIAQMLVYSRPHPRADKLLFTGSIIGLQLSRLSIRRPLLSLCLAHRIALRHRLLSKQDKNRDTSHHHRRISPAVLPPAPSVGSQSIAASRLELCRMLAQA